MLPKGFLVGNLTADPKSGIAPATQSSFSRFSVACHDSFAKANTAPKAHFFNCVAWGKNSQFIQNYLRKGDKVFIEFSISTSSYVNQEGRSIKSVDLVVENIESLQTKNNATFSQESKAVDEGQNEDEWEGDLKNVSIDDIYK